MKHDPAIHSPKFPASVKPVRDGWYVKAHSDLVAIMAFWSDGLWFVDDPAKPAFCSPWPSRHQHDGFHWFGLKEKA